VLERALAPGTGGIVTADLRMALAGGGHDPQISTVVAGLGGRAITSKSLRTVLKRAAADELEPVTFLDLDISLVEAELARMRATRRSGPSPENILRDLGVVPWLHSLFGNAAAVASGVAAALKAQGAPTSGWWPRAATAALSTSAWPAYPACSSVRTTCCTSAMTTRPT
jgi:hypothetical protein